MSGRGIADLAFPPSEFRVDKGYAKRLSGFEAPADSRKEETLRARKLRAAAKKYPDLIDAHAALTLAAKLEASGEGGEMPDSGASSVYMRDQRIKITGALWQLVDQVDADRVVAFTVIPRSWEFPADDLPDVSPFMLLFALRSALYALGAESADGWIFMHLHGEFDPVAKVYRLHLHGLAYGGMVQVVDRLRTLPNFGTVRWLPDGSPSPVYRRVHMTRKPLQQLPRQLTYLVQSFWPARALWVSEDGLRRRARQKRRLPEPYHSQMLLWLREYGVEDLTLMIGLRVTKNGPKQTKPVS